MCKLKVTFGTALEVPQCSRTITSYDRSQCVLLALSICAFGGTRRKGAKFGSTKSPPPSLQPPKRSHTPQGHTLAGGDPCVQCMWSGHMHRSNSACGAGML